jgi:tRNA(Ile)-lysidine synthase TilS/MesJ
MIQENSNLLANMTTVTVANCNIGIYNNGPVGVLVSGGADSAVLLYILLTHVKNHPIHIYSKLNEASQIHQEPAVDAVISTCLALTNRPATDVTVHKIFADGHVTDFLEPILCTCLRW